MEAAEERFEICCIDTGENVLNSTSQPVGLSNETLDILLKKCFLVHGQCKCRYSN